MTEPQPDEPRPSIPWRTVALAAIGVAVASLGMTVVSAFIAVDANGSAEKAQTAVDEVIATRTESRKNTCLKDMKFAEAHNRLVIGIVTAAGTREIPPNLQSAVDEQLVPVPDCSPAGILAFYEGTKP